MAAAISNLLVAALAESSTNTYIRVNRVGTCDFSVRARKVMFGVWHDISNLWWVSSNVAKLRLKLDNHIGCQAQLPMTHQSCDAGRQARHVDSDGLCLPSKRGF